MSAVSLALLTAVSASGAAPALTAPVAAGRDTAFFVGAHPDDIELFMGRNAAHDMYHSPQSKKVFIVTTAGDDGFGMGNRYNNLPYWKARQIGHENAILFWNSLTGAPGPALQRASVSIAGYQIERRFFSDTVVMYNLMLPDGNTSGGGFAGTGAQSLSKLLHGSIPHIAAIDGGNTYTASGLRALLAGIIRLEAAQAPTIWANLTENNAAANPGDHADHVASSSLFQSVLAGVDFRCVNQARYATYANSAKDRNMTDGEYMVQVGAWGALNVGLQIGGQGNAWNAHHNSWLGKQYMTSRILGAGKCSF